MCYCSQNIELSEPDNQTDQIFINGLPILSSDARSDWLEDKIDEHYAKNVIGGKGSFMEVAKGFNDFGRAAQKKILTEITNNTPDRLAD